MHVRVDLALHGEGELIGAIRFEVRVQSVGIHAFRIRSDAREVRLR